MKSLIVGDMHIQPNNLKESENIFDFILKTAKKHKIKNIKFLGDMFHTHGIIRVECLYFLNEQFKKIPKDVTIDAIIGNHDKILGQSEHAGKHSLREFVGKYPNIKIIDEVAEYDNLTYIPYIHNETEFMEVINNSQNNTVICHQTFNGANYENGFYAKDGFDITKIKPEIKHVISGHIHSSQEFDRIWYTGNPRWITNAEANQEKGIWIVDMENPKDREFISVRGVAIAINKHIIREGEELPKFDLNDRNFVELIGTSIWCSDTKKKIKAGISVKTIFTDKQEVKFNNSQLPSINEYLDNNFTLTGITDIIKSNEYKVKIKEYLNGVI